MIQTPFLDPYHHKAPTIGDSIKELMSLPSYPCTPALRSYEKGEYSVGIYQSFGTGASRDRIACDLKNYRHRLRQSSGSFWSFWAVWEDAPDMDEEQYEKLFWQELSWLASASRASWDPAFSDDPQDKKFCFSFEGEAYFVVGLHPRSSRYARRFNHVAMIFNLYDQFHRLMEKNTYQSLVNSSRKRDMILQGEVNPMAQKHGETWETIQFSGRNNPDNWVCPFKHIYHA